MKETKYGIRLIKTQEVLGATATYTDAPESGGTYYTLDPQGEQEWLVDSPEQAEYVRQHSNPYYNASYETPENSYAIKETEIIKVEIEKNIIPIQVTIPTMEEFIKGNYKDEPGHVKYCLKTLRENQATKRPWEWHEFIYNWYELAQYLKKKGSGL